MLLPIFLLEMQHDFNLVFLARVAFQNYIFLIELDGGVHHIERDCHLVHHTLVTTFENNFPLDIKVGVVGGNYHWLALPERKSLISPLLTFP